MSKHAYSIQEWCELYGFSRSHFYNLDKRGLAPRSFHSGQRHLISAEADAEWRREREAEARASRQAGVELTVEA